VFGNESGQVRGMQEIEQWLYIAVHSGGCVCACLYNSGNGRGARNCIIGHLIVVLDC
jgi:hypothetical protein